MEDYEFSHIGRENYDVVLRDGGALFGCLFATWLTMFTENDWPITWATCRSWRGGRT